MADQFAELNGQRITQGTVVIPATRIWSADIILASAAPITNPVKLVVGNLELKGHVFRMASFAGARSLRVVGGAGGWRDTVPAQGYSDPGGVKLAMVLKDVATAVKETLGGLVDRVLGQLWTRERAPASRLMNQILGDGWWLDPAGVTQCSPRSDNRLVTSPFTVMAWSGGKGRFEISTEDVASWQPGRTFQNATVTTLQQISLSSISVTNDGKLRVEVLGKGDSDG